MAKAAKVRLPDGTMVDGFAVEINESTERWSEVSLADGTRVKVKLSIISAARSDRHFDQNGNPVYSFDMTPQLVLTDVPPGLKKKGN